MRKESIEFEDRGWVVNVPLGLGVLFALGCQASQSAVLPPPNGFSNQPASYYTPAAGNLTPPPLNATTLPAVNLAPESAKMAPGSGAETKSSLMPKSPGAPLPAVQTGLPAASADLLPKIPDTYDITVRIPQDNQPIRIQERGTTVDNQFVPRGMAVNDGTRATAWGQAGNAPSYGGVASSFGNTQVRPSAGISMAGVRGTTPSTSKSLESPNFSARDGEWKSRSSYEATERR